MMQISLKADIFPSMDPFYPPDLDENGAVDVLYAASWICSENGLVQRKKTSAAEKFCTVQ